MRESIDKVGFNRKIGSLGLMAGAVFMLAGCVGGEDASMANLAAVQVNTPAQIAQESDDDYDNNENGLITAKTLQSWIDDWDDNRPAGVTGKLVILSVSKGTGATTYISANENNGVYSYVMDASRLAHVRSNGVLDARQQVASGSVFDAILSDYDIDPRNDMVVCATTGGNAGTVMSQGRCWYMFRYWGTPKTNLAKLNGIASNAAVMSSEYLSETGISCDETADTSCLPGTGTVSARDLPEDNMSMLATLEDVIAIAKGDYNAFLWDARGSTEYLANVRENGTIDFRNSASKQGHPKGAVLMPWTDILMSDGSGRYRPKSEIEGMVLGGLVVDGRQFVEFDGTGTTPISAANVYRTGQPVVTYCETTYRAMITGFASAAILGLPNRFYDGAMVEWNSLSHIQDRDDNFILPSDSPWRTDKASLSHFVYNPVPANVAPRTIHDAYAPRSSAMTVEDRSYRLGADSGSGGITVPGNPCGG